MTLMVSTKIIAKFLKWYESERLTGWPTAQPASDESLPPGSEFSILKTTVMMFDIQFQLQNQETFSHKFLDSTHLYLKLVPVQFEKSSKNEFRFEKYLILTHNSSQFRHFSNLVYDCLTSCVIEI